MNFVILDWAGNTMLDDRRFKNLDDAMEFLSQFIEERYPDTIDNEERYLEERGEYQILWRGINQ